jgi:hypothetical protein
MPAGAKCPIADFRAEVSHVTHSAFKCQPRAPLAVERSHECAVADARIQRSSGTKPSWQSAERACQTPHSQSSGEPRRDLRRPHIRSGGATLEHRLASRTARRCGCWTAQTRGSTHPLTATDNSGVLDIAVQEIDSRAIAQAILDARWRGVRMTIFLEQDYLRTDLAGNPPKRPTPKAGETAAEALRRVQWLKDETDLAINREILAALLRSDIEVKGDYNPKIFHQKFILRDYDGKATPTSALLSGSANFTWTDTHINLNNVLCSQRLCLPPVPNRSGTAPAGQLRPGAAWEVPKTYDLAGVPVRVLFAPDHTPELEIMKQLLEGAKECYFAIFTFAGSSGIDDAMLALARGGMQLKVPWTRGRPPRTGPPPNGSSTRILSCMCPNAKGRSPSCGSCITS